VDVVGECTHARREKNRVGKQRAVGKTRSNVAVICQAGAYVRDVVVSVRVVCVPGVCVRVLYIHACLYAMRQRRLQRVKMLFAK
jgi:hypothetical protein